MKRLALTSSIVVLVGSLSLPASAMDTDIYTKSRDMGRDDTPNVLIILDTSASMYSESVAIREPYDGTKVYVNIGGMQPNRIYWSYPDANNQVFPPSTTSNQWVSATNNNCIASQSLLLTEGTYGGTSIAAYVNNRWVDFAASKDTQFDCAKDDGATDPKGYVNGKNKPMYTADPALQIAWSGVKAPTLFTSNYMNWYYGAPVVTKTRIEVAKQIIKNIIRSNPSLRFGLMVFNKNEQTIGPHGGRVVLSVDNMTADRLTKMTTVVDSIVAQSYTPTSETMWEAYRYLSGKSVDFGNDAPSETPARDLTAEDGAGNYVTPFKYECQEGYIIYVTDGDPTYDTAADGKIAALPGIKPKNSSSKTGYTDANYLDELAEWLYNHDVITGSILATNKGRRVSTYTIGFGSNMSSSALQLLQDTAAKGNGTYFLATDADKLTASFQGALTAILRTTASFVSPALSVNAFNTLFNRDEVYFALFKADSVACWPGNIKKYTLCDGMTTSCVLGEVLDKNGVPAIDRLTLKIKDSATSYWSTSADGNEVTAGGAGSNIADPGLRNIYTYIGGYGTDMRTPTGTTDLTAPENQLVDNNAGITAAMVGVPPTSTTEAADRTAAINWLRGIDAFDEDADGIITETRNWLFADPLHSRPVAVTYGGTNTNPVVKLFVGTNDGGLRMINEYNGREEWIFYPQELLYNAWPLGTRASNHVHGLDGTPKFRIRDHSSNTDSTPDGIIDPSIGDFVHMYVSMRRGGKNVYAFDVTPATTITDPSSLGLIRPKLLWVIHGGYTPGYEALSQTWSDPKVTRIRYGSGGQTNGVDNTSFKTVLIFGGGYSTARDTIAPTDPATGDATPYSTDTIGNAIYMANPDTGERIWWASNTNSGASLVLPGMDFSIPSEVATIDSDGDGATDRLYVGDVGGQLWRIDLSPSLTSNNTGSPPSTGYRLADAGCPAGDRPNCTGMLGQERRKFFYPPDFAQVYDSVYEDSAQQKYDVLSIASGDREDPLDYLTDPYEPVHNRIYVFRDYRTATGPVPTGSSYDPTIRESDLYDVTSNPLQNEAADKTGIKASKGWFIDLIDQSGNWMGEKGMAKTVIFAGKLMVTTFTPPNIITAAEKCKPNEGDATLWVLNLLSGAGVEDLVGDGTIDRNQGVGGGIPSELVTIIRPGGVSGLVGPYDPQKAMGNKKLPRTKTYWSQ